MVVRCNRPIVGGTTSRQPKKYLERGINVCDGGPKYLTIDGIGRESFMWATDYPHPDHPHTRVDDLTRYAQVLSPGTRPLVPGDSVRRVYSI